MHFIVRVGIYESMFIHDWSCLCVNNPPSQTEYSSSKSRLHRLIITTTHSPTAALICIKKKVNLMTTVTEVLIHKHIYFLEFK
jgi:hypothetical protein